MLTMKTVLQWLIITFATTNCLGQTQAPAIQLRTTCMDHDQCPNTKACILGYCGDPCESLCGENTYCTTYHHIPACVCKEGHTGNPFIRCSLSAEVHSNTIPTVAEVPSKTSAQIALPKECDLPNESPNVFCSLASGCEDCDLNNTRCHVTSDTEVDVEAEVKIVCAPGYTSHTIDRAVCLNKGWFPSIPKCQMRCGFSKEVDRSTPTVVERQDAPVGYFPWNANVYLSYKRSNGSLAWYYKCGGSLISNKYVLTAFYCVEFNALTEIRVVLGKYYKTIEKEEPTAEVFGVSEVSFSPTEFTYKSSVRYEVALLLLSEEVKFNEYIKPVCLYFGDYPNKLRNSNLFVFGLGTEESKPKKDTLDYKSSTLMSDSDCKKSIKERNIQFMEVFCTKSSESLRKGDAGSGLTAVDEDGFHYLIGYNIYRINTGVILYGNTLWGKNIDWLKSKLNKKV